MTAAMFSSTFEKLCDGFGATDGELTMDVTLKAYQMLAAGVTPARHASTL
ncbi:putative phage DNA replication domain protein [Escherichia coli DEC12D]|nr:putative phage DNA replication domain protein [Escherichia coli DEC12D]